MQPAGEPILRTEEVMKTFGGIHALDGCSVEVRPGTITGLIGPNGAGKSTLFNVIVGLYAPEAGRVYFRGQRIDGQPPYRLVRRGLAKTFQIPRELRNLTVLENLMIAAKDVLGERIPNLVVRNRKAQKQNLQVQAKAEEVLRFAGLYDLRDEYAKNLSGGQKKILELCRSLMSDPTLILLDEPVAGVNPTLTVQLLDLIEQLRKQGKTFFLIEHDMEVVMNRCDWIIVIHQGRKLAEGLPTEVKRNQRVVEAYLGG